MSNPLSVPAPLFRRLASTTDALGHATTYHDDADGQRAKGTSLFLDALRTFWVAYSGVTEVGE